MYPASSVPQDPRVCQEPASPEALADALENERAAYWQACDVHDFARADAHGATYRELLSGQRRAETHARLLRIEREQERAARELDALWARLEALAGEFADLANLGGEGVHYDHE